jgi:hypothetical protein
MNLERQIHAALRGLPEPRAPRSLAPRVMQAVMAAPVAGAGWRQWPLAWQLLGLVAACSAIAALALAIPLTAAWLANLPLARTATVLWQTFIAPIATPTLILTAVMFSASALLVAALKHVAWEGQESSHP